MADQDVLYAEAAATYGAALERLARAYEADGDRRRDLLQDIHVALWQSLARFDGRCSLRTWIYRVAHNVAISQAIRRRAHAPTLVGLEELDVTPAAGDPDRMLDEQRALDRLYALVHQLTPFDRQVMLLYLEGVDAASIGEVTGMSAGHVATKVHRIKAILARRFHERGVAMSDAQAPSEVQDLWQGQAAEGRAMSLDELRRRSRQLERIIARRNRRESIAGVVVIIVFGWIAWYSRGPLVRVGAALAMAGAGFIIYYLRRWAAARSLPADLALTSSLQFHRCELERQRDLLRSVWTWYLLPLVPAAVVLNLGFALERPHRLSRASVSGSGGVGGDSSGSVRDHRPVEPARGEQDSGAH